MSVDLLVRVHGAAADLLSRVDEVFVTHGAPAEHPVWPAARRVGATPGAAVAHFERLDSQRLRDTATRMRANAGDVAAAFADAPETTWIGAGAEAYAARRQALDDYMGEAEGRLRATADHIDSIADWVNHSRDAIAKDLAICLGSRQAVAVCTGSGTEAAIAAADIAARLLDVIADCVDAGWDVHADWQTVLGRADWRGPAADSTLRFEQIEFR